MARLLSLGGVALFAAAIGAIPAQASLGGVSMSAQGFGVQWTFNQPGSPIPAENVGTIDRSTPRWRKGMLGSRARIAVVRRPRPL